MSEEAVKRGATYEEAVRGWDAWFLAVNAARSAEYSALSVAPPEPALTYRVAFASVIPPKPA